MHFCYKITISQDVPVPVKFCMKVASDVSAMFSFSYYVHVTELSFAVPFHEANQSESTVQNNKALYQSRQKCAPFPSRTKKAPNLHLNLPVQVSTCGLCKLLFVGRGVPHLPCTHSTRTDANFASVSRGMLGLHCRSQP